MHVGVIELLTCPACRSGAPLVLLADDVRDGRVLAGTLGCPNCKARFLVRDGIARLDAAAAARDAGSEPAEPREAGAGDPDEAVRWAALLGLDDSPGQVLLVGEAAGIASAVAALVPHVEIVAATRDEPAAAAPRISRMKFGDVLPILPGRMRAIGIAGPVAEQLLDDAARALAPGGRIVVTPVPDGGAARLDSLGLRVLAQAEDTIVAGKT